MKGYLISLIAMVSLFWICIAIFIYTMIIGEIYFSYFMLVLTIAFLVMTIALANVIYKEKHI